MKQKRIRNIIQVAFGVILLCLAAVYFYPKPEEIIGFFIIGVAILIVFASIRLRHLRESIEQNKSTSIYRKIIDVLAGVFLIYFYLALRTSFWEKKLVFNILDVQRGREYAAIAISVLLVFILYQVVFFARYKKWPELKRGDFTLKSGAISEEANEVLGWIIFVFLVGAPFFAAIWILYFFIVT